jgi:CBS domain-containing protein
MRVKEIMSSKDIGCCSLGTNLAAAAEMLWIHDCGMLPVLDDIGHVVGVLTDRDLCIALGTRDRKASEVSVGEVMPRRLFDCDPEVDVLNALKIMAAEQVRRLPVVDATGTIRGVLSINDVVRHAVQHRGDIPYQEVIEALQQICAPPGALKLAPAWVHVPETKMGHEHPQAQEEDEHVALACTA